MEVANISQVRLGVVDAKYPPSSDSHVDLSSPVSSLMESAQFLQTGVPWRWLITTLSNLTRLTWTGCQWIDRLSQDLMFVSDGKIWTVVCDVDWDPVSFLSEEYAQDDQPQLSEVVTLTGSANHTQGLTCAEYVQQTWPLHGMCVLNAVENAVQSSDMQSYC